MLIGHFDETGTHVGAESTLIAGFIGDDNQWEQLEIHWLAALKDVGVRRFHYSEMKAQGGDFASFPRHLFDALLVRLSNIVAESGLVVHAAGFQGNWERAMSRGSDWAIRFPSSYHLAAEMLLQNLDLEVKTNWPGEQIDVRFSEQTEYIGRIYSVYQILRRNGHLSSISNFVMEAGKYNPRHQVADMLCYESFSCLGKNIEVWRQWPLMKSLLSKGNPLVGGYETEESLVKRLSDQDSKGRIYMS